MASIKVIKFKGRTSKIRPKVMFFHNDNFDNYTTKKNGKYNVVLVGNYQKDRYFDNRMKAYSAKIRFHKGWAS